MCENYSNVKYEYMWKLFECENYSNVKYLLEETIVYKQVIS